MAIVDLNQIWFIDNKFGVTIRLQQTLIEHSAKLPHLPSKALIFQMKWKKKRKTRLMNNAEFVRLVSPPPYS